MKKVRFFKIVSVLAFTLNLGIHAVKPQQAHAFAGIATLNPALMALGSGMIVAGGLLVFPAAPASILLFKSYFSLYIVGTTGMMTALAGIVVLEKEGIPQLNYSEISLEKGAQLGFNSLEVATYNQQVAELNAIRETVAADLLQAAKLRPDLTVQEATQLNQDRWHTYAAEAGLSPTTLQLAEKLADTLIH